MAVCWAKPCPSPRTMLPSLPLAHLGSWRGLGTSGSLQGKSLGGPGPGWAGACGRNAGAWVREGAGKGVIGSRRPRGQPGEPRLQREPTALLRTPRLGGADAQLTSCCDSATTSGHRGGSAPPLRYPNGGARDRPGGRGRGQEGVGARCSQHTLLGPPAPH